MRGSSGSTGCGRRGCWQPSSAIVWPWRISLAAASRRPYNPPAMTRKQIDVSIYVFIVLLIAFFGRAVWGVMGMVGWV